MRKGIVLLALLALFVAFPASAADLTRLDFSLGFAPPHNEPVIGVVDAKVARYKLEANGGLRFWKRVTFDAAAKFWFLQDWRPGEVVGHGFPDAWRGSDWNFDRVRLDYNLQLGVDILGPVQAFVENNKWSHVMGAPPSAHASEYYWMAGIKVKIR